MTRVLSQIVVIRPPSMVMFAPVTFSVRSLASKSTRSATSLGWEKRPVTLCCAAPPTTSPGFAPVLPAIVSATPPAPNQHDGAAAGHQHDGQRATGRPHRRHQVEVEGSEPLLVGDIEEAPETRVGRTHVVDEDVDPVTCRGDQSRRPLRGRQIDGHHANRAGVHQGLQLGRGRPCAGDDPGTLFDEPRVTARPIPLLAPVTTAILP